jgi:hypothetical protein
VNVLSSAYADSGDLNGSRLLELRGSFVARITGEHEFKLWQTTYGTSTFSAARPKWTFEDMTYGPGPADANWYVQKHLTKDFRYYMRQWAVDSDGNEENSQSARMSIDVQFS